MGYFLSIDHESRSCARMIGWRLFNYLY